MPSFFEDDRKINSTTEFRILAELHLGMTVFFSRVRAYFLLTFMRYCFSLLRHNGIIILLNKPSSLNVLMIIQPEGTEQNGQCVVNAGNTQCLSKVSGRI